MSRPLESGAEYARDIRRRRERGFMIAAVVFGVGAGLWFLFWILVALFAFSLGPFVGLVFVLVAFGGAVIPAGTAYLCFRVARPAPFPGDIAIEPEEPIRGQSVKIRVIRHGLGERAAGCDVGLVAVERYDVQTTDGDGNTHRGTSQTEHTAQWARVEATAGEETLEMQIPADGSFSYEGDAVAYRWRLEARVHRRMRPDRRAVVPIWVRP